MSLVYVTVKVGDQALARPWSKYSEGSSANKILQEKQNGKGVPDKKDKKRKRANPLADELNEEEQKEFQDFLHASKPRSQTKLWANDDALTEKLSKEIGL